MPITLDVGAADRGRHRTEEPIFAQSLAVPDSVIRPGRGGSAVQTAAIKLRAKKEIGLKVIVPHGNDDGIFRFGGIVPELARGKARRINMLRLFALKESVAMECAPRAGQVEVGELTGSAGLSKDESHEQAPFP